MKGGSLIAFSPKAIGAAKLAKFGTTRISVNGEVCTAVPLRCLRKLCAEFGIYPEDITKVQTDYQGIYYAKFKNSEVERIVQEPKQEPRVRLRSQYMELCGAKRRTEDIATLSEETKELTENIQKYQEALVKSIRLLEEKQDKLSGLQSKSETSMSRYADEFDQLMKHPDIERMEIKGHVLVIFTKPIFIEHGRARYDIGKFEITINSNSAKDGMVRMHNLTRIVEDKEYDRRTHHPHVDAHGRPCLGNIQEALPNMIGEYKYAAVAVCIQYLKSYEFSDNYAPYSSIKYWPKARNKKGNATK